MLKQEMAFFRKNAEQYVKEYKDLYVLIYKEKLEGVFKTVGKAVSFALENGFVEGEFLVKKCTEDYDVTLVINSNVLFSLNVK